MSGRKASVLVLGGGPDAEREVSLKSAGAIARALRDAGREVHERTIGGIDGQELRGMPGEVIWPALHGPWGEGGPMQDLLEADGRAFVGCGARTARMAMDKMGSKLSAARVGVRTAESCVLNVRDEVCPLALPVVVKPVFEGSTIGLFVCRTSAEWEMARAEGARSGKAYMVERFVGGEELTVGLVERGGELAALPHIRITPKEGLYDYEAKYTRNDTVYEVGASLPGGAAEEIREGALRVAREIGVRGLSRADFMLSKEDGRVYFLEINTMPGFTDHSLVPMAARASGLEMPGLCDLLADAARSGQSRRAAS
ncbi:MAG: D-alanine--D-alanine ligase [Phycisphaerales bacterium]